jgi:predicted site-specific integrase-resolvase
MALRIGNETYYRTSEACHRAGISKATLFRWIKSGILKDVVHRDRKGWRLFSESDIDRIKSEVTRVNHR